ncbi:MAG: hypothetical protein M1828_001210 [Chrysothrix sp. TS-e1954]|nr:MAG: hypothetical protein M1828_001210 [Chrysothrix sp. TS-e1954]
MISSTIGTASEIVLASPSKTPRTPCTSRRLPLSPSKIVTPTRMKTAPDCRSPKQFMLLDLHTGRGHNLPDGTPNTQKSSRIKHRRRVTERSSLGSIRFPPVPFSAPSVYVCRNCGSRMVRETAEDQTDVFTSSSDYRSVENSPSNRGSDEGGLNELDELADEENGDREVIIWYAGY